MIGFKIPGGAFGGGKIGGPAESPERPHEAMQTARDSIPVIFKNFMQGIIMP
jgi:hypothetical protein